MKTIREQQEAGLIVSICLVLAFLCLVAGVAFGEECQDPDKLSPELKEAYYQLKELEKEIEGMTVRITCEFTKPLTIGELHGYESEDTEN